MKKYLLIGALLFISGAYAQKKITAHTLYQYDELGGINSIDSTAFTYADYRGSILSHQPFFGVDLYGGNNVDMWNWDVPSVNFTQSDTYSGNSNPLSPIPNYSNNKTYDASFRCLTNTESGIVRDVFTYTPSGKLSTQTYEWDNSGTWEADSKKEYKYDASDRLIVRNGYQYPAGVETLTTTDTIEYDGTSNNIIRLISYLSNDNGVSFEPQEEVLTTFTSNQPSSLKYLIDDDSDPNTPLVWFISGTYNYTGMNVTNFVGYMVFGGVPTTTVAVNYDYTYSASNLLLSERVDGMFGMYGRDFTYDADNYLNNVTTLEETSAGGSLFVSSEDLFYYQNTASLVELPAVNVTIFPVPSTDKVTVETTEKITAIQVLSMDGKVMIAQKAGNTVDISSLANGNYLLQVVTNAGTATKTIVKN